MRIGRPDSDRETWIDISRPIREATPVWPGDTAFVLRQRREPAFVLSSFETTCHVGTHLDAPLHLDGSATAVENVPIGRCVGPADVVAAEGAEPALTPASLPSGWEPQTPRVLIRTNSYPLDREIGPGFAGLSPDLVHWLADHRVELIGVDTPSVDPFESEDLPAHHALLNRGLTWIEGLWLENAAPGTYFLSALPILLEGAEAAPVRAVLAPLHGEF